MHLYRLQKKLRLEELKLDMVIKIGAAVCSLWIYHFKKHARLYATLFISLLRADAVTLSALAVAQWHSGKGE